MRAQKDPEFASICDRVGNGKYSKEDIKYLNKCVRDTKSEDMNDKFKDGKVSYIVTTNKRRQNVNEMKLENLNFRLRSGPTHTYAHARPFVVLVVRQTGLV